MSTKKRDLTKMKTPHTYVIIFIVVVLAWLLTFLVPAGKFSTQDVEYKDANGETSTRTVLRQDTFRYDYRLDQTFVYDKLTDLANQPDKLAELDVDKAALKDVLADKKVDQAELDGVNLTDDTLYDLYGDKIYDKSENSIKPPASGGQMILGALAF